MATQQSSTSAPILFPAFSPLHADDARIGQSQPTAVIPFSKPAPQQISQYDLVEYLYLKKRAREAKEQFEAKEADLRARLESKAEIEEGVHVVSLEETSRRSVAWKDVVVRLAERLKMDGAAYCANVLAHTKPTKTISLEVN
jgi:hypothetical protein